MKEPVEQEEKHNSRLPTFLLETWLVRYSFEYSNIVDFFYLFFIVMFDSDMM